MQSKGDNRRRIDPLSLELMLKMRIQQKSKKDHTEIVKRSYILVSPETRQARYIKHVAKHDKPEVIG